MNPHLQYGVQFAPPNVGEILKNCSKSEEGPLRWLKGREYDLWGEGEELDLFSLDTRTTMDDPNYGLSLSWKGVIEMKETDFFFKSKTMRGNSGAGEILIGYKGGENHKESS